LLGDLLPPLTPEEISPPPLRPAWPGEDELRQLAAESESVRAAIDLLNPLWARARAEGSKTLCEQRLPAYRDLIARLVTAALAFGEVVLDHHRFVDDIRRQGASWSFLRPVNLERFGDLNEGHSSLNKLIGDAIEAGHVPADVAPDWSMPASLQHLAAR
jgi:hypothetical protein